MNLSPHFTLEELISSEYAARHDIDNTPRDGDIDNLEQLAYTLEQVRTILKAPIIIYSAYRNAAVNAGIGGSQNSAHLLGLAADIKCPQFGSPYLVAEAVRASGIRYDQLIREYGWVHLGLSATGQPRRMDLTKRSARSPYEPGILA